MSSIDPRQYPIGKFQPPAAYTPELRAEHLRTLAAFPGQLRAAAALLTEAELDTPYREGGWTRRQVIHHLADSHMHCYIRIRFALTENAPVILPYNEVDWSNLADAADGPLEPSLQILQGVHSRWVALMQTLPEEAFDREFLHPVNGPTPIKKALALYAWHSLHHLQHVAVR